MITRWWRRVVSCLYPHLCPDHFASFSTFGFFRGLHKSDSLYRRIRQLEKHCVVTRSSDVRLCDHQAPGARVCGRQWSPGPGLISVNCEWVRASLDSLFLAVRLGCSCAPGWAGDTDTDTVLPGAGLPIPGPWQLTALCWTLGRSLSAGLWSLVSRAGSDVSPGHTAAQARPGRRQCSVYLGPQSGGHHPGQQREWQPDGQLQDPDEHGHGQACCVTNSYKYQGQAENLITQTIKSASIKLVITSNSITTKCYNCIQLWIFTMTRWQQTCTRYIHSTFYISKVSFLINPPSYCDQKSYSPKILGSLSKVSHVYFNFPSLSEFGEVKLHQNFLSWSWPLQIKLDDESVWNIWSEINIDIISSPCPLSGFYLSPLSLSLCLSMHFLTPLSIFDGIVPAGLESGARLKLQRSLIFFLLCFTRIVLLLACQPPRVYKKYYIPHQI